MVFFCVMFLEVIVWGEKSLLIPTWYVFEVCLHGPGLNYFIFLSS